MASEPNANNDKKRALDPSSEQPPNKRRKIDSNLNDEAMKIPKRIQKNINKYESYITSNHETFDQNKPWKIFNEKDAPNGMISKSECKLCNKIFKRSTGKGSHVSTSKAHQIKTLQYYLDNNIAFPYHIVLKSAEPSSSINDKKNSQITKYFQLQSNAKQSTSSNEMDQSSNQKNEEKLAEDDTVKASQIKSMVLTECKGFHIDQLFFTLPPSILRHYNVKIHGDSLHHVD